MTPGLHSLALPEAMTLWGELVEALHGVNGFGSDTAELYAYRFGHYSPLSVNASTNDRYEEGRANARVLFDLLTAFADHYRCHIEVNGRELGDWLTSPQSQFNHRVHVRVWRKPERT